MMDFNVGDSVIHWTYGLGKIIGLEERALNNQTTLYYVVQIQELTVCVPADAKTMSRLRIPTSEPEFKNLFAILSGSGESLSDDRFERKNQLRKELAGGTAETICRVIRDLTFFQSRKQLNDDDKNTLKHAWSLLCGEWVYSLSVPLVQVETELRRLLAHPVENVAV
jgi:RNA polymerase-interacting CarD/CdnL/TRCF family regulator